MRYVRILGLCFIAALMLSIAVATGASAKLPEWGKCNATGTGTGGKYVDGACTVKAHDGQGAYEWEPVSATLGVSTEEMTLNGVFTFETSSAEKIECGRIAHFESYMVFLPTSAKTPLWVFKECKSEDKGCSTLSIGAEEEEISNLLPSLEEDGRGWNHTSQLKFIEGKGGPNPVVGVGFRADNGVTDEREPFFTPISCEGSIGTVLMGGDREGRNSIIGTLSPANQMQSSYTLTYGESSAGVQAPQRFENQRPRFIEAFVHNEWKPVAFVGQINFIFPESYELKATK